jgi:hypothetical protein
MSKIERERESESAYIANQQVREADGRGLELDAEHGSLASRKRRRFI